MTDVFGGRLWSTKTALCLVSWRAGGKEEGKEGGVRSTRMLPGH